jgi:ribosomal protein S6--L-glutamate ligase
MLAGHENRLCAGRDPGPEDLAAVRRARAVLLPQGCRESLYRMAKDNAPHVFPNYDARFAWPGKLGQARLFEAVQVPRPETALFPSVEDFERRASLPADVLQAPFPWVFKFDWGGEGDFVHAVEDAARLNALLSAAREHEKGGRFGFLLQEYVPHGGRTARAAVLHDIFRVYFRVADDAPLPMASAAKGARIERGKDPAREARCLEAAREFCGKTGINLAGIDLLFREDRPEAAPLLIEVNWFFGRRGLGGSEAYYRLLEEAADRWLGELGLRRP